MLTDTIGVGIIAYNRPEYLKWTLLTLENQELSGNCDFHFFLDGAASTPAKPLVYQSKQLFEISSLHNKHKHIREKNAGIAQNQLDARDYLSKNYSHFIIVEDDVVLSKYAIRVLRVLADHINNRVFSAGISFIKKGNKLDQCFYHNSEHWWCELYSSKNWQAVRPYFMQYYQLVKDVNYKMRDHKKIRDFYSDNSFPERRTSQDSGVDFSLFKSDMRRVTTSVNRGMYIGIEGTHFNEQLAEKYHFNDQVPYQFESDATIKRFTL